MNGRSFSVTGAHCSECGGASDDRLDKLEEVTKFTREQLVEMPPEYIDNLEETFLTANAEPPTDPASEAALDDLLTEIDDDRVADLLADLGEEMDVEGYTANVGALKALSRRESDSGGGAGDGTSLAARDDLAAVGALRALSRRTDDADPAGGVEWQGGALATLAAREAGDEDSECATDSGDNALANVGALRALSRRG